MAVLSTFNLTTIAFARGSSSCANELLALYLNSKNYYYYYYYNRPFSVLLYEIALNLLVLQFKPSLPGLRAPAHPLFTPSLLA